MNTEEVCRKLKESLEKREEIIFAYIHGSFIELTKFRDIDIAVYVNESLVPHDESLEYALEISALTELETGISPLDTKVLNYASIGFRYHATKGILLFSKDEDKRADFLEDTWKRYFDLLPKRKQIIIDLLAA